MSPPGTGGLTGGRSREVALLEEQLDGERDVRRQLEASLAETERALRTAQLEIERVQLFGAPALSVSSDGNPPSSDDEGVTVTDEGARGMPGAVSNGLCFLMGSEAQNRKVAAAKEQALKAAAEAKAVRRKFVESLAGAAH